MRYHQPERERGSGDSLVGESIVVLPVRRKRPSQVDRAGIQLRLTSHEQR